MDKMVHWKWPIWKYSIRLKQTRHISHGSAYFNEVASEFLDANFNFCQHGYLSVDLLNGQFQIPIPTQEG